MRIRSIDFARGFIMIIMALDHVRDLIHVDYAQNPLDLQNTHPTLFFTRWITHICAPTFMFLAGASVYLSLKNSSIDSTRTFLISRGIWLILIEFTVMTFAIWWDVQFRTLSFIIIGAFGTGFIVLSSLLKFPAKGVGIAGIIIIAFHDALSLIPFAEGSVLQKIIAPFFFPAVLPLNADHFLLIGYPPIPWLGILLAGYGAGLFFEKPEAERRKLFMRTAYILLALFIALRFVNRYGDRPWMPQSDPFFTFLSFINVTKTPPSLLFVLTTIGIAFLLLRLGESVRGDIMLVYGRVPFFYYIVHFYIIHILMFVITFIQGFSLRDLKFGPFMFGKPDAPSGFDLTGVYIFWILLVIAMYPLCKWYGNYKSRHPEKKWLRYL